MAPSFEPRILGVTIPEPFLPGIVVPLIVVVLVLVWPWIDARITGDRGEHNLLDWWWEKPFRAATGAGFAAAFVVATLAGGNDVIAASLAIPVERLTVIFIWALFVVPAVTAIAVFFIAHEQRRHELARGEGVVAGRPSSTPLARNREGGFDEVEV
jgi:ubiquinol-cytochrome c reductase cytochrome b subunit